MVDVEIGEILPVSENNEQIEIGVPYIAVGEKTGNGDYAFFCIKAKIKLKGDIWTFHKFDSDPFPSQPHGHNYEKGTKLNVYDGRIYRQKCEIGMMDSRYLDKIKQFLIERGFKLAQ